jgi:Mg2+-importing ATPase
MVLKEIINSADYDIVEPILDKFNTSKYGLTEEEAEKRIDEYGYNEIGKEVKKTPLLRFLENFKNPLVILLAALAVISYITGDLRAAIVMIVMVAMGVILKFVQEMKADESAEKLKSMVSTTATVIRDGKQIELPLRMVVPGDIVHLASGDMIPADVQLFTSKDLYVNQSALTGESLPVEKNITEGSWKSDFENPNLCFMGTNVESGTAIAVVTTTGSKTYFGQLSSKLNTRPMTSFDKGVNQYTWLMIKFIFVMAPVVFLINGFTKGNWFEAFLFGIAVAVGLTPEMLPMIVTVNLSKGAVSMSKKKVIVKKLNAIQNFGAMDVLCTDKTGTITCGKVELEKHLNIYGVESERVLKYAYINSFYQTGLRNVMDTAILEHKNDGEEYFNLDAKYIKKDEIPFDFIRKRMSVVVENKRMEHVLICKGAIEEVLSLCNKYETKEGTEPFMGRMSDKVDTMIKGLNAEGFRVLALAYRIFDSSRDTYTVSDESEMTLLGFLAFLDPPKETSADAINKFHKYNVDVKVLTGDNEIVTKKICHEVNLSVDKILLGSDIDAMTDEELSKEAEGTSVFAKLSPMHKERIVKALQKNHVVGFMGDGINDAPALKASDVGISVDSAVDIAKESSDIILLENNLLVLEEGVLEGRRVFGNIVKYIKMTASSNFGNMFSVLGASIFLPFLPMMPIQVLTNNLLYDVSQTTIPTDSVDEEWIEKPRKWAVDEIKRFILFIGPISSIFDYTTYFIMLYVFKAWHNPNLFQTGWFMESLMTQTLIIHVIRTNKIPFIQSRASRPLMVTSLLVVAFGAFIVNSPLASAFGFVKLPGLYWMFLCLIMLSYVTLTQLIKVWYVRKYGI